VVGAHKLRGDIRADFKSELSDWSQAAFWPSRSRCRDGPFAYGSSSPSHAGGLL